MGRKLKSLVLSLGWHVECRDCKAAFPPRRHQMVAPEVYREEAELARTPSPYGTQFGLEQHLSTFYKHTSHPGIL